MSVYNLVSFVGLFVLMFIAWCLSTNRKLLNFRCIGFGLAFQLILAFVIFRLPASTKFFSWLNDLVIELLGAAMSGQSFLFGPLALGPGQSSPDGSTSIGFILAIQALPVVVFFSALMALLYHFGVMQKLISLFAWVFTSFMRISGAESLCASSNIFVGIESVTSVRPYLEKMTRSEFCTILSVGMATVASSTLGVYVLFLKDVFPTIAGHLISASILSAPAAIIMSKLLVPEDGQPVTLGKHIKPFANQYTSAIDSIITGSMAGVKLLVGICALLLAFLGLLAVIDLLLGWAAGAVGILPEGENVSILSTVMGYLFAPIAMVVGVPKADAIQVGQMLGTRLIATEIPAYIQLSSAMAEDTFTNPRSAVITAYALCGFAHFASLAVFVGGVAALVPNRRPDLAAVAIRALIAANLACLMVAAVAGVFFYDGMSALK